MADARHEAPEEAMTTRIGQAVMLHRAGDREEARHRFAGLWAQVADAGDPFHRCTIAHYMADTQDDPAEELAWDERALAAADALAEDEVHWERHALAVRSLYPSLHLNLAADHAALGDVQAARGQLRRARETSHTLADDAYGAGITAAIERLERRLGPA